MVRCSSRNTLNTGPDLSHDRVIPATDEKDLTMDDFLPYSGAIVGTNDVKALRDGFWASAPRRTPGPIAKRFLLWHSATREDSTIPRRATLENRKREVHGGRVEATATGPELGWCLQPSKSVKAKRCAPVLVPSDGTNSRGCAYKPFFWVGEALPKFRAESTGMRVKQELRQPLKTFKALKTVPLLPLMLTVILDGLLDITRRTRQPLVNSSQHLSINSTVVQPFGSFSDLTIEP